jgi:aconitate hydratase
MRGTFANIRIKNEMLDGVEGGYTLGPDGRRPRSSTRRWPTRRRARRWSSSAASNTAQGRRATGRRRARPSGRQGRDRRKLRADPPLQPRRHGRDPVRVHRRRHRKSLGLKGDETVSIHGLDTIQPLQEVPCTITYGDGTTVKEITLKCRIDTAVEIEYIEHGGVLHYVLRNLAKAPSRRMPPAGIFETRGRGRLHAGPFSCAVGLSGTG